MNRSDRAGRVGVIGGGLGGLAAACTLAARGFRVVLFERSSWLGGKAATHDACGYRFDMGPTILTLPSVLCRIFAEAGRRLDDYLDLVRIDPQWRSFFADGTTLDLRADTDQMKASLNTFAPGSGEGYRRLIELSARMHEVSNRFFFWRPVGGLRDMFNAAEALDPSLLRDLLSLNIGRTVAGTVRSHVPDARVAQMLDHFTQYVGSAPDASPAVLCGIAHMQTSEGVWYPRGGMASVPQALTRLATELGVEIRTGVGVRQIVQDDDGGVRGIETEAGETVALDAVVSNSDAVRTHRELIGGKAATRFERRRRYEPACSGVVLYLGLDRRYDHLLHHNFVFSTDPEEEFESIYRRGEPAADPTCYVCAPARTEPDVAPAGGEALYVLVHTPYLRPHHDWGVMFPAYRETILEKLRRTAGLTDISNRIRVEHWLTPSDIHRRYGVLDGAIYGIASHGRWLGAFKPSNRSPDVKGLYLAGGAAHPGPGVPMVLMSGWIAADTLDRDGIATGSNHGRRRADLEGRDALAQSEQHELPREPQQDPAPTEPRPPDITQGHSAPLPVEEPPARPAPSSVGSESSPAVIARYSPLLVRLFRRHVKRRYLARDFHAVRLSRGFQADMVPDGPLIVALNHPSWWDPLVALVLTELFPDRAHFAAMDAEALKRYRFFERIGMFGVERGTTRGSREFLRVSRSILARPRTALWLTPQGRFADARERPPGIQPGLAHLARGLENGVVLPLALEYPFWDERRPEAIARFGQPIVVDRRARSTVIEWHSCIEAALERTQNALAREVRERDPAAFETLVEGRKGTAGLRESAGATRVRREADHPSTPLRAEGFVFAHRGPS